MSSGENGRVICRVVLRTSWNFVRRGLQANCSAWLACMASPIAEYIFSVPAEFGIPQLMRKQLVLSQFSREKTYFRYISCETKEGRAFGVQAGILLTFGLHPIS